MPTQPVQWRSVADAVNDSLLIVREDGGIIYANPYACRKLGYSLKEMQAKRVFDFNTDFPVENWKPFLKDLREKKSTRLISSHMNREGHEYPVLISVSFSLDACAEPVLVSYVTDITDTLRVQQQLQLAINSAQVGFWDFNLLDGTVFVSPELHRQLGEPEDRPWDLDVWRELLHPDDYANAQETLDQFVSGNASEYLNVFRLRHHDGSYRWIETKGTMIRDRAGQPERMMGTHLDVTEQKLIEEQLRATLKKSEQTTRKLANSNHELEQFAYVASHDLRAPLRGLSHLVSWIQEDSSDEGVELPEAVHQHLSKLSDQVERMDNLLSGLLAYSRAGKKAESLQQVDLHGVLDDAIRMADLDEKFRVLIPKASVQFKTYKQPLLRVLQNLLDNAAKHHDKEGGEITIAMEDEGSHYRFHIIDDGPGVPRHLRKKIFEIFETLGSDRSGKSSGIGLSIVKKLLQYHGGSIDVLPVIADDNDETSTGSRGANFSFTWPKDIESVAVLADNDAFARSPKLT